MEVKLKVLSGIQVTKILENYGFSVHAQNGSHIKLRRTTMGIREILIVPNHNPIAKGTLKAIFTQASQYISETELRKHFYN